MLLDTILTFSMCCSCLLLHLGGYILWVPSLSGVSESASWVTGVMLGSRGWVLFSGLETEVGSQGKTGGQKTQCLDDRCTRGERYELI